MQSNINYCLLNWGGAASIHLNHICVSLNKAVRAICFKNGKQNANILYKELDLLPLDESYKLHLATFMWKLENNKLPESITSRYTNTTHTYNTRQSVHSALQLPCVRLDHAKRFTRFKFKAHMIYGSYENFPYYTPYQEQQKTKHNNTYNSNKILPINTYHYKHHGHTIQSKHTLFS